MTIEQIFELPTTPTPEDVRAAMKRQNKRLGRGYEAAKTYILSSGAVLSLHQDHAPYNDFLIVMWFFTREREWLTKLWAQLDSKAPVRATGPLDTASSALWAIMSLRRQHPHFALAWDLLDKHPLQAEYERQEQRSIKVSQN